MKQTKERNYPVIEKVAENNQLLVTYKIQNIGRDMSEFEESGKMRIPYLEDVCSSVLEFEGDLKKIILVADSEKIACKCAKFLVDHEGMLLAKRDRLRDLELDSDPYGIYHAANAFDEEFELEDFDDEYFVDENDYDLKLINIPSFAENKELGVNLYANCLSEVQAEAVLYTGLEKDDRDVMSKVEAILADQRCAKYIWITPKTLHSSFITMLRMEQGYEVINIKEVPRTYYEGVLETLLEESKVRLTETTSLEDVLCMVMKYRGSAFCEEDLDWLIKRALYRKEITSKDNYVLNKEDFMILPDNKKTAYERLSSMPGLSQVKEIVVEQMALRKEGIRNKTLENFHNHMIFYGNPGTGKTTCARLFSEIMADKGISNAVFIEATRNDIIGKYVGATASKVADLFEKAKGGVLFVDEAGFFLNENAGGYLYEAIKEFVRYMENCDDVTVIFGMYEREAERFMKLDEGLSSRISRTVAFEDYDSQELEEILKCIAANNGYTIADKAISEFKNYILNIRREKNFGNAREVRKVFESAVVAHSVALLQSVKNTCAQIISKEDMCKGIARLQKIPKVKKDFGFQATSIDLKRRAYETALQ